MLKLSVSSVKAQAQKPVGCSEEALAESIMALSDASEALYSACASVDEVSTVLGNMDMIAQSIKAGGLTKQVVAAFNSEGELSACVGQENLTIAGLESLGADEVKTLTATYSAGLEGKMAEYWNKFVAFLKNLWSKIVNWFKSLFVNRARFVSKLEEYKKTPDDQFDVTKKFSTILKQGEKAAAKLEAAHATIKQFLNGFTDKSVPEADKAEEACKTIEAFLEKDAKEASLKSLGFGSIAEFKQEVATYIKAAKSEVVRNASAQIDKEYKLLIKKAGEAGAAESGSAEEHDLKETIQMRRHILDVALKLIRVENQCTMRLGNEYVKAFKASKVGKKEETSEPAKK